MEPPPLAGRIMALAAARSTPKEDNRLMRSVSSNSAWLVVWAARARGGGGDACWVLGTLARGWREAGQHKHTYSWGLQQPRRQQPVNRSPVV